MNSSAGSSPYGPDDLIAQWFESACRADVLNFKPGNVCPGHEGPHGTVSDFLTSAQICAPLIAETPHRAPESVLLDCVRAVRRGVGHNTNLGILLLCVPLAAVPIGQPLQSGVTQVIDRMDRNAAAVIYEAIRTAAPGGMGTAAKNDISNAPTDNVRVCMSAAADHDLVARQYADNFRDVLDVALPLLEEAVCDLTAPHRVTWTALRLIARYGDSLVARRFGPAVSQQLQQQAASVLAAGWPATETSHRLLLEWDQSLRSPTRRLNPGTTADIITAAVFAGLRDSRLSLSDVLTDQHDVH